FVLDMMRSAVRKGRPGAEDPHVWHLSAHEICDAFRHYARFYFNDDAEAKELLSEWGIRTSSDLGQIIFAMVACKRLVARPEDRVEQFDGVWTLDTLFEQPG